MNGWDGTERRKNMDGLQELKIEFASFSATMREWMNTTKQYRTEHKAELCAKIDSIKTETRQEIDRLCERLPCKDNDIRLRKCETDLATIKGKATAFGVIGGFISGIIAGLFKPR